MEPRADIALIGLAVMGQNLILNMNDHGFTVVAYNRTISKVDEFLNKEAKGTNVIGARSIQEMVSYLKRPRRIMMLVKAGAPVDEFIEQRPQAVRALTTELLPGTHGELIRAALHLVAAGTTRGGRVHRRTMTGSVAAVSEAWKNRPCRSCARTVSK